MFKIQDALNSPYCSPTFVFFNNLKDLFLGYFPLYSLGGIFSVFDISMSIVCVHKNCVHWNQTYLSSKDLNLHLPLSNQDV